MNNRRRLHFSCFLFNLGQVWGQQVRIFDRDTYYNVNSSVKNGAALQLIDLDNKVYCCAKIAQRKPVGDPNSVWIKFAIELFSHTP